MAYAIIDGESRIVEWSEVPLEGAVEFSNGEYIDQTCINGIDDFKVVDGVAIFEPKMETKLIQTGLTRTDIIGLMADSVNIEPKPAEKVGYIAVPHYVGETNTIVWTFEEDPDYSADEDGTYLKPFTYSLGMGVELGLWYTDGFDIWEAVATGIPSGFDDASYFDIII